VVRLLLLLVVGAHPIYMKLQLYQQQKGNKFLIAFNALPSGAYTVKVVDNLGAINTAPMIVPGNYAPPTLLVSGIQGNCIENNGELYTSVSYGRSPFICDDIGINPVTLTVYDIKGNVSSCMAYVTVLGDIGPTIVCPEDIMDKVSGVCEFEIPDYISQITVNDNCESNNIYYSQTPAAGTIIPINYGGTPVNPIVTMTATDSSNNTNLCYFNVDISCIPKLNIPQFFTPNGDGINDYWKIVGIEDFPKNDVQFFNRYGQLVYNKVTYDNSWNGKVNTTLVMKSKLSDGIIPMGTYYYIT
jgi:gliding motility-associated-like protein